MAQKDQEKWDRKYLAGEYITGKEPCRWLTDNLELLTGNGRALDLAAGEGRNAVFLVTLGYDVLGVDISPVGIQKAKTLAKEKGVDFSAKIADLDYYEIPENSFDLIVCFNFLDRGLFPAIRKALKPAGMIFYETFNIDYLKYSSFKREWVLEPGELLREFTDLRILRYREVDNGEKGFASIVCQKTN